MGTPKSRADLNAEVRPLRHVPGTWVVCQWPVDDPDAVAIVAALAARPRALLSLTRTLDEISAVLPVELVPSGAVTQGPFSAFVVEGTLAFSLVGILHGITAPLAAAGIPVFALSTFNTDYLLVPAAATADAAAAWRGAGYPVVDADVAPG